MAAVTDPSVRSEMVEIYLGGLSIAQTAKRFGMSSKAVKRALDAAGVEVRRANQHGLSNHPLYPSWSEMKRRCLNPDCDDYEDYGGRGIKPCAGFLDIRQFIDVMGDRPEGKSLDRIENNSGYHCGRCEECVQCGRVLNCRWATAAEQNANTRATLHITYNGQTQSLSAWAKQLGVRYLLLWVRLNSGWDVKTAFETPVTKSKKKRSQREVLQVVRAGVISRCYRPSDNSYKYFGAKGVTVCQQWQDSYDAFYADVGYRPGPDYILERLPGPNLNYEPGNVRWVRKCDRASKKGLKKSSPNRVLSRELVSV